MTPIRAVWTSIQGIYKKVGFDKAIKHFKKMHLDEVYLLVCEGSGSLFPSKYRPQCPRFKVENAVDNFIKLLHKNDFKVHAWIVTLNFHHEIFTKQHKDWYVVNKLGVSCIDNPPYTSSYKWLCPSKDEVVNHVADYFYEVVSTLEVDGVHFDYIRFPDILLPVAIRPRYEGVPKEDVLKPDFDYCYCATCRSLFQEQYGVDPMNLKYIEPMYGVWFRWRTTRITHLVKFVYNKVKKYSNSIKVSAAVFPTPKIAYEYVFQDWTTWGLDYYNPMIYHKYYNKTHKWIGEAVREGVLRGVKILAGISIHQIDAENELRESCKDAIKNGAIGICIFSYPTLEEKIEWISRVFRELE